MSNAVVFDYYPDLAATVALPANRGRFANAGLIQMVLQTLPTDAIGTFALTLNGVVVGSAIQIEDQAGTTTRR